MTFHARSSSGAAGVPVPQAAHARGITVTTFPACARVHVALPALQLAGDDAHGLLGLLWAEQGNEGGRDEQWGTRLAPAPNTNTSAPKSAGPGLPWERLGN